MRRLISLLVLLSISFFMYGQRSFSKDPIFDEREPILSCAQPSITDKVLSEDAGTFTFQVNAIPGCRWTLSSNVPWMTVSQAIGLTSATITVTYTSNTDTENRYGILRLNTVNITVTQYGQPAAPDVPAISIVSSSCGEVVLTSTAPFGETYYWQGTSCGTSTSNSSTNYSATSSGTYYLRARDNSTGLWSTSCGSKTVSVTPDVEAGTIAGGGEYCSDNTSTITLTLENYSGAIANWMRKTPFGNWELINNTKSTYRFDAPILGIFEFKAVVYNVECGRKESPVATIKMLPPTTSGSISGGTNTCAGNSIGTLTLSGYNGDIKYWQRKLNAGSWTTISNTAGQTTLTQAPATPGTYYYRVAVENTTCGTIDYSSTKAILVSAEPVGGSLGSNKAVCEGSSTGTMTLTGHSGTIVRWERRYNSGSWVNISNTITTFSETPSNSGLYQYRVLVDNGTCTAVYSSTKSVTVRAKPAQPSITASDNVNCTVHAVTLSAPTATAYQWNNGKTTKDIVVNQNDHYAVKVKDAYGCWSNYSPSLEVKLLPLVGVMLQEPLEEGQRPLPIINLDSQTTGLCEKAYEIRRMPEGGALYINGELYDDDMNPLLEGYFAPGIYGLGTHNVEYRYTDQTCGMITKNLDVYVESYVNEVSITDDVYRNDASIALTPSHNYDIDNNGTVSFKVDGTVTSNIVPQNLTEGTHTLEQVYTQSGCVDSKQTTFEVKPITYFVNSTSIKGSNYDAITHEGQLDEILFLAVEDANKANTVHIAFDAPGLIQIEQLIDTIKLDTGKIVFYSKDYHSVQGIDGIDKDNPGLIFSALSGEIEFHNLSFKNLDKAITATTGSLTAVRHHRLNHNNITIHEKILDHILINDCSFGTCNNAVNISNTKNITIKNNEFSGAHMGTGVYITWGKFEISDWILPAENPGSEELEKIDMQLDEEKETYQNWTLTVQNNIFSAFNEGFMVTSLMDHNNKSQVNISENSFISFPLMIRNPSDQWILENNSFNESNLSFSQFIKECSGFKIIENGHSYGIEEIIISDENDPQIITTGNLNTGNTFFESNIIVKNRANVELVGLNLENGRIILEGDEPTCLARGILTTNSEITSPIRYETPDAYNAPNIIKNNYLEIDGSLSTKNIRVHYNSGLIPEGRYFVADFYLVDANNQFTEHLGYSNVTGKYFTMVLNKEILPNTRIAYTITATDALKTSEAAYYHIAPNVIITEIPSELEATNAYKVNYEFFPTNNNWTKGNISMDINEVVWDVEDAYISDPDPIGQVPGSYTRALSKANPFEIRYFAVGPRTISVTTNANNWSASSTKSVFISSDNVLLNTDKSYIYKVSPRKPVTNINTSEYKDGEEWIIHEDLQQAVQYMDGLGRLVQTIGIGESPDGKDLITANIYDNMGREKQKYLGYARYNNGEFRPEPDQEIMNYYHNGNDYYKADATVARTNYPYSETVYDESPLNRVVAQSAPGRSWRIQENNMDNAHVMRMDYQTNAASEVRMWIYHEDSKTCTAHNFYPEGTLYKNITKDENHNLAIEYKTMEGNLVLKQSVLDDTTTINTYYVYDDFNRQRFVIPPQAVKIIETENYWNNYIADLFYKYCYYYDYDSKHRMIEKKLPGAAPIYMVYDKLDRLILSQDGNMREYDQWLFTKYDIFNRPVYTGIYEASTGTTRSDLQALANAATQLHESYDGITSFEGYTNITFPTLNLSTDEIFTVSYFDNYDFCTSLHSRFDDDIDLVEFPDHVVETAVKGLQTGSKEKVLNYDSWITSVNYYDDYGRVIQTFTETEIGDQYDDDYVLSTLRMTSQYDFVGNVVKTLEEHNYSSAANNVYDEGFEIIKHYEYDHSNRLTKLYHKLNEEETILIAENKYNQIGELIEKNIHESITGSFLQSIDYRYNVRGWLSSINNADLSNDGGTTNNDHNDLFGMELGYHNTFDGLDTKQQYNGNISAICWQSKGKEKKRAYKYFYDGLNRLKNALYREQDLHETQWEDQTCKFSVNQINYDLNGNIELLIRNQYDMDSSLTYANELGYSYSGNKLVNLNKQLVHFVSEDYNSIITGDGIIVADTTTNDTIIEDDFIVDNEFMPGSSYIDNSDVINDLPADFYAADDGSSPEPATVTDGTLGDDGTTNTENDYYYDVNGNMRKDNIKGLNFYYNYLNLPRLVDKLDQNDWIEYVYSASGTKLRKLVFVNDILISDRSYLNGAEYNEEGLDFIFTKEGRLVNTENGFVYHYQMMDVAGNVRMEYADLNNDGNITVGGINNELLQETDYYPFGKQIEYGNFNNSNKYLYNKIEYQEELGLNWYLAEFRGYDGELGRFWQMDPVVKHHESSYAWNTNNPISYPDPSGADSIYVLDQAEPPTEDDSYTASKYVIKDGIINGPYTGSSFPDDDDANTLNEGEYTYNNEYGHAGGDRKGLNIVDEEGNRNAPGTDPDGNQVNMVYVNDHDSFAEGSRYSEGCPTTPHGDPEGYYDNFDWSGSYNGHTGTTGNSTGTYILQRGEGAEKTKEIIQIIQGLQQYYQDLNYQYGTNFTVPKY